MDNAHCRATHQLVVSCGVTVTFLGARELVANNDGKVGYDPRDNGYLSAARRWVEGATRLGS